MKNKLYSGINFTKDTNGLYTENYETLLKEIKDINKWSNTSWP
jgi:hypothetical protein